MQNESYSEGHDQIEQVHDISSTAVATSDHQLQVLNDQKPGTHRGPSEERIPSHVADGQETRHGAQEEGTSCTVVLDVVSRVEGDGSTDGESSTGERVCRICHLSSRTDVLVPLGCACKEELGISHQHCAETWFIYRGNRTCEICGKLAENIVGIGGVGRARIRPEIQMNDILSARNQTTPYPRDSSNVCLTRCCNFFLAFLFLFFFLLLLSRLHGL